MRTAFITGATSGIGREFARRYALQGYALILTGRRRERLEELRRGLDVPCRLIEADLADTTQVESLFKAVASVNIDVFINNAGFGTCGDFLYTDTEKEMNMLRVNDMAMHYLFKQMLRKMEERGKGVILNVASSAGLFPGGPYMAAYYASKAYAVSLTRAVATELKAAGSRVRVYALCPGPVDTEFNENADVEFALKGISAAECVDEAIRGMKGRSAVIVPTLFMKAVCAGQRLLPPAVCTRMVGMQQKKKRGNNPERRKPIGAEQ